MVLKKLLVFSLCTIPLSTFLQAQTTETTDRNLTKKVETTSEIRNAPTRIANTTDIVDTTDIIDTNDITDYLYNDNCDQYYDICCCDCWGGYCQRPTYCDPCFQYQPETQILRDFIQNMPSICVDHVDLLHNQSPKLVKFILQNHKDVKSLIAAAHPFTTAHFMKTVNNFGEILSKFEGRYIESIFVKISNPCQYFLSLPEKVRNVIATKSEWLSKCQRESG